MKVYIALQILKLLYDNQIISAEKISTRVNISTRSVYRYIDELTVAGIPVQTKAGRYKGGIYLPAEYKDRLNCLCKKELMSYVN